MKQSWLVYLMKFEYPNWELDRMPSAVIAHVMLCHARDERFELLDYDFFDDTSMVMILRSKGTRPFLPRQLNEEANLDLFDDDAGVAYLTHFDHTPAKIPYGEVAEMVLAEHRETWALRLWEAVQNGRVRQPLVHVVQRFFRLMVYWISLRWWRIAFHVEEPEGWRSVQGEVDIWLSMGHSEDKLLVSLTIVVVGKYLT